MQRVADRQLRLRRIPLRRLDVHGLEGPEGLIISNESSRLATAAAKARNVKRPMRMSAKTNGGVEPLQGFFESERFVRVFSLEFAKPVRGASTT